MPKNVNIQSNKKCTALAKTIQRNNNISWKE